MIIDPPDAASITITKQTYTTINTCPVYVGTVGVIFSLAVYVGPTGCIGPVGDNHDRVDCLAF